MGQKSDQISPASPRRWRLGREITLTLLVKLALIIAIKFAFFSDPVDKGGVERRMQDVFSAAPVASRPNALNESPKENP